MSYGPFHGRTILAAAREAAATPKGERMKITVNEIAEGDRYRNAKGVGWDALEDAELLGDGVVSVRVQHHPDGGIEDRIWDDPTTEIEVER
jgi:hypothetical protein